MASAAVRIDLMDINTAAARYGVTKEILIKYLSTRNWKITLDEKIIWIQKYCKENNIEIKYIYGKKNPREKNIRCTIVFSGNTSSTVSASGFSKTQSTRQANALAFNRFQKLYANNKKSTFAQIQVDIFNGNM